ncbi:hypothetical protein SprV_0100355900 [Sparganum proliferum]
MLGSRINEHKLAVRRGDALSQVAAHTYEMGHEFNFAATKIVAHAGNKTGRELIEAWASDENSVNRFIDLAPAYRALRSHLQPCDLGSIHADLRRILDSIGRRLVHDHRLLRVDDQAEVLAGSGEEIYAPLRVPLPSSRIEGAAIGEQKFLDGGSEYTRLKVHSPAIEKLAVRPVGNEDPGTFITVGVHQHGSEHETEESKREGAALRHSVGHCECLWDGFIVCDSRNHTIVEPMHHLRESFGTAKFLHDSPQSVAINLVSGFFRFMKFVGGEDHVGGPTMTAETALASWQETLFQAVENNAKEDLPSDVQ